MKDRSVREFDGKFTPEEYFDKIEQAAGRWWFERYPAWASTYAQMTIDRNDAALREIGTGDRILDIGCGLGDMLHLSRGQFRVRCGIDAVPEMAAASERNLTAKGASSDVFIKVATAEDLPFPDQHFDAVTLLDVYEHITPSHRATSLREISRVLKADGRLVLATPSRPILRFWQVVNGMLSAPIHLIRQRPVHIWRFQQKDFTEQFCSRRELLRDLRENGFDVDHVERVCFYPAPETTGFFGMCLQATMRWSPLHKLLNAGVRVFARIPILRQKLLVRCSRSDSSNVIPTQKATAA
ncbi:MAG: hypothetical protein Fues2KO_15150 [Fuerstiella sp.]